MNCRLPVLSLLFALVQAFVQAQEPAPPSPPVFSGNMVVEARVCSLPKKLALPLIRQFRSSQAAARAEALVHLDELIESGVAKLHGWPVLVTGSGQRSVIEDVDEFRYATAFEAERITVHVREEDAVFTTGPEEFRAIESAPQANAFETRNLGISLEVEPTEDQDGRTIRMNFVLQHVALKEVERITIERESLPAKKTSRITVEQPRFSVFKVTTSLALQSGDAKLVGVFKSLEGDDQLEIFVLRAEITGIDGKK